MRKAILWVLIALMALQGLALAEPTSADAATVESTAAPAAASTEAVASDATNGMDAARTTSEIYLILPSGEGEMLVRLPLDGGQPVCMDRADSIDGLMNYGAGVVYLKTTDGSSAIMTCTGTRQSTLYSFGMAAAEHLSSFGGKLLVLMNGLLHSVEPDTGVCLKLSGAQMLDYVVGDGYAYYLAGGDQMEYTAQLGNDETATVQAGCIYRLNLNNGETDLLLKSGGEDLKLLEHQVYFHNLADAYAVRTGDAALLRGRVYSLDTQLKTLESACTEPDSGFWPTRSGLVAWYNGALNLSSAAGEIKLCEPENGSTVTFDGEAFYVWEPTRQLLTEVRPDGTVSEIYTGDLTQATSLALLPESTPTPAPSASATPESDVAPQDNSEWFTNFMNNVDAANNSGSSSGSTGSTGSTAPKATPIGATPTPVPTATAVPVTTSGTGSSSSGSTGSSSGSSTTYSTYSVSISSLKITGAVNLRSKPLTSSTIYTSIPAGKIVSCTGKAAKTSGGSVWYQVKYNGTTGWIYSGYAVKYSSSSSDSSSTAGSSYSIDGKYVQASGDVNIRSNAGTAYKKLGTMPSGASGTCLGLAAKDSRGVVWYKVKYNGVTGWVSSRLTKVTGSSSSGSGSTADGSYSVSGKYVKVVGGSVNIRSNAGTAYKSLGTMPSGAYGTCLGLAAKDSRGVVWYKVKYNGITGWVSSRYSKLTDSKGSGSSGGSSSGDSVKIVGGDVTIRSKADKTSSKLGYIPEGKTASYLGKTSTDSRGVQWYYISYGGVKGWVSSMYARLV